jgi:hypothetical protein
MTEEWWGATPKVRYIRGTTLIGWDLGGTKLPALYKVGWEKDVGKIPLNPPFIKGEIL